MQKNKGKVVVAMSGGVDSSVVAALLKKQGYDVTGVFMQFWFPAGESYGENRCCSLKSWHEACEVAGILEIPIHKVNFGRQFKKTIVDEFLNEYKYGHTPNPCIACNKFIKFDLLFKYAKTVFDADFLATGHYVRLKKEKNSLNLSRPKDLQKDQTYFLYNLKQNQLKHLLFPLAEFKKEEIRKLAKKYKMPIHDKKDSQEICFVGSSHYDFLKKYLKLKPGNIIDENKKVLGSHNGLPLYTIGQRSGIGISGGPWYVEKLDYNKNQLLVTKDQKKSDIFKKQLVCDKANWINGEPKFPLKCLAQIRYHSQPASCRVTRKGIGYLVEFDKPQRAITSGQSIVFYNKNILLGGAIIR